MIQLNPMRLRLDKRKATQGRNEKLSTYRYFATPSLPGFIMGYIMYWVIMYKMHVAYHNFMVHYILGMTCV